MKQLVTAYVLVPDCEDWEQAEVDVATALTEAGLEVQAVKWEEKVDTDAEEEAELDDERLWDNSPGGLYVRDD
jgi:hypothetical protein